MRNIKLDILNYIEPAFDKRLFEAEDQETTIQLLQCATSILETTEGLLPRLEQARRCSLSHFQLSAVNYYIKYKRVAADEAATAFSYDQCNFELLLPMIKILLNASEDKYDKVAAKIALWLNETAGIFHERHEDAYQAYRLMDKYKSHAPDLRWAYADISMKRLPEKLKEGESLADKQRELVTKWELKGRKKEECDAAIIDILCSENRHSEILELWGDRPLSDAPSLKTFLQLAFQRIDEGKELPETLEFPETQDVYEIFLALKKFYADIEKHISWRGFSYMQKEEDSKEANPKLYQKIDILKALTKKVLDLYHNFFIKNAINGSCTLQNYPQCCLLCGNLFYYTGDIKQAIKILKDGFEISSDKELDARVVQMGLAANNTVNINLLALMPKINFVDFYANYTIADKLRDELMMISFPFIRRSNTFVSLASGLKKVQEKVLSQHLRIFNGYKYDDPAYTQPYLAEEIEIIDLYHRIIWEWGCVAESADANDLFLLQWKTTIAAAYFNEATYEWAKDVFFAENKLSLLEEEVDPLKYPDIKDIIIKTTSAAGILLAQIGDKEKDSDKIQQGIQLIEKAYELAQNAPLTVIQSVLVNMIRAYELYGDSSKELEYCDILAHQLIHMRPHRYSSSYAQKISLGVYKDIPTSAHPSRVFAFVYERKALSLIKMDAPKDEIIEALRQFREHEPGNPVLWYYTAFYLSEGNLDRPDSKEFEESVKYLKKCLPFISDENFTKRKETIELMIRLALAQNRVRFVRFALEKYTSLLDENVRLEFMKKCDDIEAKILSGSDKQQAIKRRERTIRQLNERGIKHNGEELPLIEVESTVWRRGIDEICDMAIRTILIANFAKNELERKRKETINESIYWVSKIEKTIFQEDRLYDLESLYRRLISLRYEMQDSYTPLEFRVITQCDDEKSLQQVIQRAEGSRILLWALSHYFDDRLFDTLPETPISIAKMTQSMNMYETHDDLLRNSHVVDLYEILDKLDLIYVYQDALERMPPEEPYEEQYDFIHEEEDESPRLTRTKVMAKEWLRALNWLINADGMDSWAYVFGDNE